MQQSLDLLNISSPCQDIFENNCVFPTQQYYEQIHTILVYENIKG